MFLFILSFLSLFLSVLSADVVLLLDKNNAPVSLTSVYNSLSCAGPVSIGYTYSLNISNNVVVFASGSIPLATVTRICNTPTVQLSFTANSNGIPITFGDMSITNLALSLTATFANSNWAWSGYIFGTSEYSFELLFSLHLASLFIFSLSF